MPSDVSVLLVAGRCCRLGHAVGDQRAVIPAVQVAVAVLVIHSLAVIRVAGGGQTITVGVTGPYGLGCPWVPGRVRVQGARVEGVLDAVAVGVALDDVQFPPGVRAGLLGVLSMTVPSGAVPKPTSVSVSRASRYR